MCTYAVYIHVYTYVVYIHVHIHSQLVHYTSWLLALPCVGVCVCLDVCILVKMCGAAPHWFGLRASGRVGGGGVVVSQSTAQRLSRMQLRSRLSSLPPVARVFSVFLSFVLVSFFNILDAFADDSAGR